MEENEEQEEDKQQIEHADTDAQETNDEKDEQTENVEPAKTINETDEPELLEEKVMSILVTKRHKIQDEEEDQDIICDTTRTLEEIATSWIVRKMIAGVKDQQHTEEGEKHAKELQDCNIWLSDPKVTGTNAVQVEIFFTIKTEYALREIIEEDLDILKAERLRFNIKRTTDEHANKVGFLTGPIIDEVNMPWYDRMLKFQGKLEEGTMEV